VGEAEEIPLFFTLIPILALLSNYDQENCLINVGTEGYVRADPTEKLEAIEAVVPPSLRKGKFRPPDKLLALLKGKL
jgi:hypothetical protein